MAIERVLLRKLEENYDRRAEVPKGSPESLALALERLLYERELNKVAPITTEWRSRMMARRLLSEDSWRGSDVVITGTAHALTIASLLGRQVDFFIGEYSSAQDVFAEVRPAMKAYTDFSRCLQSKRDAAKFLHRW